MIKITLHFDATTVLCQLLAEVRLIPPKSTPGLEIETLLCHEFHDRYMARLHYPRPDEQGHNKNKFTLPYSTALAIMRTLHHHDMAGFAAYDVVLRDDLVSALAARCGHLLNHTTTAYTQTPALRHG